MIFHIAWLTLKDAVIKWSTQNKVQILELPSHTVKEGTQICQDMERSGKLLLQALKICQPIEYSRYLHGALIFSRQWEWNLFFVRANHRRLSLCVSQWEPQDPRMTATRSWNLKLSWAKQTSQLGWTARSRANKPRCPQGEDRKDTR